jgi:hypothetical protein
LQLRRRRHSSKGPRVEILVAVAAAVVVAAGIWWFWLRSPAPEPPPAPPPVAEGPEAGPPAYDVPPLDLPELRASDAFVRDMVARLSSHPQLAAWLVPDRLIERFVLVVVELAGGQNPASHIRFMAPEADFTVREVDGRLVIAPESHRRYDLLAATFASLDTQGTVQLYRQMLPLLEEAFQELGLPDQTFDATLQMAIQNLQAVDVPPESPEVVPHEGVYEYRDPEMEGRRGGEKAMARMGPQNVRRIQGKLQELADELGMRR